MKLFLLLIVLSTSALANNEIAIFDGGNPSPLICERLGLSTDHGQIKQKLAELSVVRMAFDGGGSYGFSVVIDAFNESEFAANPIAKEILKERLLIQLAEDLTTGFYHMRLHGANYDAGYAKSLGTLIEFTEMTNLFLNERARVQVNHLMSIGIDRSLINILRWDHGTAVQYKGGGENTEVDRLHGALKEKGISDDRKDAELMFKYRMLILTIQTDNFKIKEIGENQPLLGLDREGRAKLLPAPAN